MAQRSVGGTWPALWSPVQGNLARRSPKPRTRMISFFPDLKVWLALSVAGHRHSGEAWNWLSLLSPEARLIFSRYTQVGLLRLVTNRQGMGEQALTLRKGGGIYDRWVNDPRA